MKDDVTKSSLQHSVEITRSSTWELEGDSETDRNTAAKEINVVQTNLAIGKEIISTKNPIEIFFQNLRLPLNESDKSDF